jgi:hypothetical protein
MNKPMILSQVVFGISGVIIHYSVVNFMQTEADYIWAYYMFFLASSVFIASYCANYYTKKPDKVGLMFIALMFGKMLLFTLIFIPILFFGEKLNFDARLNIIVPFTLFLFIEAWSVYRVLNPKSSEKK